MGCNPLQYLSHDQWLVARYPRFEGNQTFDEERLAPLVRTAPNKKIIFFPYYLHLYTLGQTLLKDTSRKVPFGFYQRWLEATAHLLMELGEPPAVLSETQLIKDIENLKRFYFSKGFFHTQVQAVVRSLRLQPRKVEIIFRIQEGKRYYYDSVSFKTQDATLLRLLDSAYAQGKLPYIQKGAPYDESGLGKTRLQIADLAQENGFFAFSPENVSYWIDTTQGKLWLQVHLPDSNLIMIVDSITIAIEDNNPFEQNFQRNDYVKSRYCFWDIQIEPKTLWMIKLPYVLRYIQVCPTKEGLLFKKSLFETTRQKLYELGMFSTVYWQYFPNFEWQSLYARLTLRTRPRWGVLLGIEGFQSSDNQLNANLPGFGVAFSLTDRSLFRKAEQLRIHFNGNLRFYKPDPTAETQYFFQFNQRIVLRIPRMWLISRWTQQLIAPTTLLQFSHTTEQRAEFSRTQIAFQYSYRYEQPLGKAFKGWQAYGQISLININRVDSRLSPVFQEILFNLPTNIRTFVIRDYIPRYNTGFLYNLTLQKDYEKDLVVPGQFIQFGVGFGGTLPLLLDWIRNQQGRGDGSIYDGLLDGTINYGQYWKAYAEYRRRFPFALLKGASLVRLHLGIAGRGPYSLMVPFEERYFLGGLNSMRAWQNGTLGPGLFRFDTVSSNLITPGGEYVFEVAWEYRQPLFSYVEGAVFVEAGNVWFAPGSAFEDPRGLLSTRTLQLGWDAGIGIRLDFDYFIMRFDIAQQLYAPDIQDFVVKKWHDIGGARIQYNVGIGYPF